MNKAALPALSKSALSSILNQIGEVIYSSHETLKKGGIYLMGYNPGGAGFITIEEHIDLMLSRTTNSYLDESWTNRQGRSSSRAVFVQYLDVERL